MINDNKLCGYIYQRQNKTDNNQCPNKVFQNNDLCSKHKALLKYNISRQIGLVRNENKNHKFIQKGKTEEFNKDIEIKDDIHKDEKMSDVCSIIDDNDNDDDNDIDIIISKLQSYFDQRYELRKNSNENHNSNNSNGSGFNMNTMMMLMITSLIPIIIKKIGFNNIGDLISNATNNKEGIDKNIGLQENTAEPGKTATETTETSETNNNEGNTTQNKSRALQECIG